MAAAFHRAGHRVLSEDTTCVRLGPEPAVVPGPARPPLPPTPPRGWGRRWGGGGGEHHPMPGSPGAGPRGAVRVVFLLRAGGGGGRPGGGRPPRALGALRSGGGGGGGGALVRGRRLGDPVSRLRRPLDLGAIDDHLELVLAGG